MMRLRFSISALLAISVLSLGSLQLVGAAGTPADRTNEESDRGPVLVELFTSEGCSSCPPADVLLERLDRSQPIAGAELIVLSEHVDYWNDSGWKDPYSSNEFSQRQSAYAAQFGLGSIYTPQMVVDGRFELVGSDERRATQVIDNAAKIKKIPVSISFGPTDEKATTLHIETGPLPRSITAESESASVFLAIADNSDESHVSWGENAGRTLKHVAVLRSLIRIGAVDESAGFSRDVKVDLNSRNPRNLRIAVIVQESGVGRVLGAGLARSSN
jgi:hypothetical protein